MIKYITITTLQNQGGIFKRVVYQMGPDMGQIHLYLKVFKYFLKYLCLMFRNKKYLYLNTFLKYLTCSIYCQYQHFFFTLTYNTCQTNYLNALQLHATVLITDEDT